MNCCGSEGYLLPDVPELTSLNLIRQTMFKQARGIKNSICLPVDVCGSLTNKSICVQYLLKI